MSGQLPGSLFTKEAIKSLSLEAKEFRSWYQHLGAVKRIELVDRSDGDGETFYVFRFEFSKGSRVFAVALDKGGKVTGFFPDA